MGFRDERNANRLRIDALEDELAERDAEITRLQAKLSEREASAKRAKKKRQTKRKNNEKGTVPKASDLPPGDVWDVETTHPEGAYKWGIGWFVLLGVGLAYLAATQGPSAELLIPLAVFGVPGLALFKRRGLTLDRKRKTITRWDKLLLALRRTWSAEDESLEVVSRHISPKNGKSWTAGVVRLGDHELFMMRKSEADELARRIAAYLEIALSERRETTEEIHRRATEPLRFVVVFMVVAFVVAGLWTALH